MYNYSVSKSFILNKNHEQEYTRNILGFRQNIFAEHTLGADLLYEHPTMNNKTWNKKQPRYHEERWYPSTTLFLPNYFSLGIMKIFHN